MFECSSAAGIVSAVNATMVVALLSDRHIRGEMQIMTDRLPLPPSLAYVIRRARKSRNPALDSLVREIEKDIGRQGGLALAGWHDHVDNDLELPRSSTLRFEASKLKS